MTQIFKSGAIKPLQKTIHPDDQIKRAPVKPKIKSVLKKYWCIATYRFWIFEKFNSDFPQYRYSNSSSLSLSMFTTVILLFSATNQEKKSCCHFIALIYASFNQNFNFNIHFSSIIGNGIEYKYFSGYFSEVRSSSVMTTQDGNKKFVCSMY